MGLVAQNYLNIGAHEIENYIYSLRDNMISSIDNMENFELQYNFSKKNQSQIIKLKVKNVDSDFSKYLKQNNILVNTEFEKEDCFLRVGLHYYNNLEDINYLIKAIDDYNKK